MCMFDSSRVDRSAETGYLDTVRAILDARTRPRRPAASGTQSVGAGIPIRGTVNGGRTAPRYRDQNRGIVRPSTGRQIIARASPAARSPQRSAISDQRSAQTALASNLRTSLVLLARTSKNTYGKIVAQSVNRYTRKTCWLLLAARRNSGLIVQGRHQTPVKRGPKKAPPQENRPESLSRPCVRPGNRRTTRGHEIKPRAVSSRRCRSSCSRLSPVSWENGYPRP